MNMWQVDPQPFAAEPSLSELRASNKRSEPAAMTANGLTRLDVQSANYTLLGRTSHVWPLSQTGELLSPVANRNRASRRMHRLD